MINVKGESARSMFEKEPSFVISIVTGWNLRNSRFSLIFFFPILLFASPPTPDEDKLTAKRKEDGGRR
jgi:hypothetical protein